MKITYRPHRGGYAEAMKEQREYTDILDMLRDIVCEYENQFEIENISIQYYVYDPRNDWDTFVIKTNKFGDTSPCAFSAVVGWCKFD